MSKSSILCAAAGLSLLSACAQQSLPPAVSSAPAIAPAASASGQLRALLAQRDEADLQRHPLNALYRDDMRSAGQLGDYMSDAYLSAERAAAAEAMRQTSEARRAVKESFNTVSSS